MSGGFLVRQAGAAEAGLVQSVMAEAYSEYRSLDIPSGALEETPEYVKALLETGQECAALCTAGESPVGSVRFLPGGDGLYFRRLGVIPEWRGRGAARAMLAWLEEYAAAQGAPVIWCKVRAELPQNIALYASTGYEVFAQEDVVKPDGRKVPVVSMRKRLGQHNL